MIQSERPCLRDIIRGKLLHYMCLAPDPMWILGLFFSSPSFSLILPRSLSYFSPLPAQRQKRTASNEACTLTHNLTHIRSVRDCGWISMWFRLVWLMTFCAPVSRWTGKQHKHYHNLKGLIIAVHIWQMCACVCVCVGVCVLGEQRGYKIYDPAVECCAPSPPSLLCLPPFGCKLGIW